MDILQRGFWSGVMATSTMTLSLFKTFQRLPTDQKAPLPPAQLTAQFANPIGLNEALPRKHRPDLTLASHYGYGVACGLLYAASQRYLKVSSPAVKGGLFGLGVWAASYLGWIPAMGLKPSGYKMPLARNSMMIISHLVWGASLGIAEENLRKSANLMLDAKKQFPNGAL